MRNIAVGACIVWYALTVSSVSWSATTTEKMEQIKTRIDQGVRSITVAEVVSLLGEPEKTQFLGGVNYLLYETEYKEFYLIVVEERRPNIDYKKINPEAPPWNNLFKIKVDARGVPLNAEGRPMDADKQPSKPTDGDKSPAREIADRYLSRGKTASSFPGRKPEAIEWYSRAIAIDPTHAEAYTWRGYSHRSLGNYKQAFEDFDRALDLKPEPRLYNLTALRLVTCPEEQYRDGKKAIQYAEKAIQLVETLPYPSPNLKASFFNTLAAAYAETGDFDKAVETQKKAYESFVPETREEEKRKEEFKQLIEVYRNKQTYAQWETSKKRNVGKIRGQPLNCDICHPSSNFYYEPAYFWDCWEY